MSINKLIISVIVLLALILSTPFSVDATPRYSVQYKQNCQLCHANPAGGGMRTAYGAQFFSHMDLPWEKIDDLEELEEFNPVITKNLQIGADFRSIYWTADGDTTAPSSLPSASFLKQNSFLTMQGDVYLAITPNDKTLVYIEKGIQSSFEAFVQFRGIKGEGVVKAGRFIPAYGWRFPDHRAFVRDYLGFSQYATHGASVIEDHGFEIGYWPMEWEASFAVTNGGSGAIDNNEGKALTARAAKRESIGGFDATLGGSWRYGEIGENSPGFNISRYYGFFYGLSANRLTFVGEVDWIGSNNVKQLVMSHYITYGLRQGLNLLLSYDFYDPDLDLTTGSATRQKLGIEYFPTGYLSLTPAVEMINDEVDGYETTTLELQMHVWF